MIEFAQETLDLGVARSGPKLKRRKPAATSGAIPIASRTWLALALPEEQALPAETAIPARSSWISIAMLVAPESAIAPIVGTRGAPLAMIVPPTASTPLSSFARSPARCVPSHRASLQAPPRSSRARYVLGSPAIAFFLPPAARPQRREVADKQGADPGRATQLMGDKWRSGIGKVDLRGGLSTIGEQQRSCFVNSARAAPAAGRRRFRY